MWNEHENGNVTLNSGNILSDANDASSDLHEIITKIEK
jgi:hypothetical protein